MAPLLETDSEAVMKTALAHGTHSEAGFHFSHAFSGFTRLIDGLKAYAEERRMRADLADLDPMVLKDIGVGEDEIDRVRTCESFTPRAWRT